MKKTIAWILCLCICLLLFCCAKGNRKTFPEGAMIGGVSVENLTREEAEQKLLEAARTYTLKADLEGIVTEFTASDLGVTYRGGMPGDPLLGTAPAEVFSVNPTILILDKLQGQQEAVAPTLPILRFDETMQAFICVEGERGIRWDYAQTVEQILEAARAMEPEVHVFHKSLDWEAIPAEEDTELQAELERANRMLNVGPELQFYEETETLSRETIARFLTLEEDRRSVCLDEEAVLAYASELAEAHTRIGTPGRVFYTSTGSPIILDHSRDSHFVDAQSLCERILKELETGVSGKIEVPYYGEEYGCRTEDFGGTYVEVDIPNQMVYCYQDYELVVSTPCVTGCVAAGNGTPTGVYRFYRLSRNAWLSGPTWNDWVDCWMAFHGGFGMHDANWRDSFGGDIYLENGSHGCVNLPPEVAPTIYAAISIGETIILY